MNCLALCLLVCVICVGATTIEMKNEVVKKEEIPAAATKTGFGAREISGTCGERARWTFDEETFRMIISGSGTVKNFTPTPSEVSWDDIKTSTRYVVIEEGIGSIGGSAFLGFSGMINISIPTTVTTIGMLAFNLCTSLLSITVPVGIKYIGASTFAGCNSLESITIPNTVTSIAGGAFTGCSSLTNLTLPMSITQIGNSAFFRCSSLTELTLPTSITTIGKGTFEGCTRLTSITIPDNVGSIGADAFSGCSNLRSINTSSVKSIGDSAFSDCSSLKSIDLSSAESIGDFAFKGCSGLTSVTIPAGSTNIGPEAFLDCTSLKSVIFLGPPSGVCDEHAFDNCPELVFVCVPTNYTHNSLCGTIPFGKSESCEELASQINECFEALLFEKEYTIHKRQSAIAWEHQTNGCMEYKCENESGHISKSKCSSMNPSMPEFCVDAECVTSVPGKEWSVLIDFTEGLNELEVTHFICSLTDCEKNRLSVGFQHNDDGLVLHVIIFADEEDTAKSVLLMISQCKEKGNNTQSNESSVGVIDMCQYVKRVSFIGGKGEISFSSTKDDDVSLIYIIVGSCIAGAVLMISLVLIIIIFIRRSKNSHKGDGNQNIAIAMEEPSSDDVRLLQITV